MREAIKNRYDFVFLFDVKDGNPNGDPDQGNLPRVDAENQEGIITDVCIKRKVRNYVMLKKNIFPNGEYKPESGYDIQIREGVIFNNLIKESKKENKESPSMRMCEKYYDVRCFGAVLSTGEKDDEGKTGAKVVRGPVQFTFSRSIDRVYQVDHSITRMCGTKEEKHEMGRKATVPYALYRMNGFISAVDAVKTGFSQSDLDLLWESLLNAFEHDRAAARGEMNPRKLIIFKHGSHLGNARSGELFDRVTVAKKTELPRSYQDYEVNINKTAIPSGVTLEEKL